MPGQLLCRFAIVLWAMMLTLGIASAADVPPHLVGFAKSLVGQIDDADFAAAGDPALSKRAGEVLRRARLRSWAGSSPKTAVDPGKFAEPLGLDLTQEGHRAALDRLLAARDPAARRSVLEDILRQARGPQTSRTLHEAEQSFRNALAEQLGSLQKRAKLEAGPGESVEIEWDPGTSSVLARVSLGEDQGEVVLHGGAAGKIVDGELVYDVEADAAPVTQITPAKQAEINANVFGVWSGSDGAQWIIRGGGEIEAAASAKVDPAALALEQIDSARQQLAALEKDKVFIWVDPGGGEVIQKKFKRLGEPYRFDRARSENFHRDEIAALRERIAAAEKELKLPPVKQHDPLGLKKIAGGKGRAIEIEVWEASGWRYLYDEASFDGKRLTASRTLRDARDISDLPDWVINGLVTSWSPPEWIEFEAKFNPRDKSISLEGLWWRLNVTYDPTYHNIESIHTPYSMPRVLQREHEKIMLRIVDLEGKSREIIHHDEPFRLQARFTEAPDGEPQGLIKREGGDASVELALAGDGSDARLYESGILYGRSVQYAKRNDPGGLFVKERFVDQDEFEAKTAEWRKLTGTSQPIAAELFEGNWKVSHVREGNGGSLSGAARVNAAGTSARLVLGDGTQLYQSTDMRALRGKDPDPHFLEINFERVEAFGDEPASASPAPLPKGEIIYFPTLARSLGAELEGASASAGLDLKPVPEETINILLKSRGPAHLAGGWHEVLGNGDHGHGGQQTWVRDIEISGVVVMEEQNKRSSPTTAFYPWGPQASAGSSPERTLFIFGRHLPTSYGDAVIFNSLTDGVSYHTPRFPNEMPQEKVDEAWRKAAAVPRRTIDETSAAPPSEGAAREADVGLFVTARFEKGAEPGVKVLTLNEAPGLWLLDFADARGRAYFVDTPPIDGAPTDIFQSSDAGFLELELEAPIPYKKPLVFTMNKDGTAAGEIPLALLVGEGSEGREGRVYRSPPLHFFRSDRENWAPPDEAGAIKFDVAVKPGGANSKGVPDSKEDNRFTATLTEPLRLSVPKPAEMQIIDEDNEEMSELWRKALERAAACHGGKVKIDPRATSQENSNFILTEFSSRKVEITIGDHAAAILVRDEFVKFSRAVADGYAELGYESKLNEFIEAGVASAGRSDPLWKVMSNKAGGQTYTAEQMLDLDALAALRKSSRDYAIAFRRDQVRIMAREYMHSILASTARATAAGDCKVDELLVIAGQPAPMIAARILPRLVTRKEEGGRTFWEPDVVARAYVRTLYIKGAELRALEEYAAIDDTYKALALAAAGGGVAALASKLGYLGVAAYATVTADAIDMAYFGVKGVLDYQKAEEFHNYARGASATLGADYYEEAAARRQSALGAAAGVLLPGLGVAAGTLGDIRHLARTERGAEIARRFNTVDAASLAKLSDAERLDLLAYVDDIKEAARLKGLTGAAGTAEAILKSTGRHLDDADTNFLKAFDTHAANVQSQIKRGRDIAARLDDFEGPALNLLTKSERADIAEYVKNVRFREEALKSGDFGKSLAVPSARETELARKFDEMTKVADEAASPSVVKKVEPSAGPLPATPAPSPGLVTKLDNLPTAPQPAAPKVDAPGIDDAPPRVPNDQASLTPPPPEPKITPSQPAAPNQPVRVDSNSARGPPIDEPAIAKPAVDNNPQINPPVVNPRRADDVDKTPLEPTPLNDPAVANLVPNPRVDNNPALDPPIIKPRPEIDLDKTPVDPPPAAVDDVPTKVEPPALDPDVTKDFPPDLDNQPPPPPPLVRVAEPPVSAPERIEWAAPLKPGTAIPLRGNPNGISQIVVDKHLGAGSNNSVYSLQSSPAVDTGFVARISKGEADSLANRVDQEGWRALGEISDDALYVPKRQGPFEIDGKAAGRPDLDGARLELVEFVPQRATDQIPASGVPTPGQAVALDRAKRAVNAKGFVWLDNHPGNYGFRPRGPADGGADEWQVVIFDPGGIVKVVDEAGNPADVARRFQTRLENPSAVTGQRLQNAKAARDGKVLNMWNAVAREEVLDEFGKHVDLSRLGIDSPAQIPFRADGMVFYPNVRALSKIDGTGAALDDAYKALRAQKVDPPAVGPGPVADANKTPALPPPDLPPSKPPATSTDLKPRPQNELDKSSTGQSPNAADPHATAPHPAPDPDETVLLDMEMAEGELKRNSSSNFDPNLTAFEPPPRQGADAAIQGSGKQAAIVETPPAAPGRADASAALDKTEDFPPPKDVDPANPPQAPPGARKLAPFDSTGLSDKIDTTPGYKFAKPAPDVDSIKGEETFFAGKAIEFPTSKMNKEGVREMRRIPGNIITSMGDTPDIELGNLIGQGAGASVFSSKADPTKVIRISEISADANAGKMVHYDMVGRYVGEALQRPDGNGFFRLTRTHGQFVTQDMSTKTKYLVTIEENIAHTGGGITNAADRFRVTPPNPAQELTKALAIREMNRRGVVWTDHKLTNFDIIENPQSPTGYQMLIFDTGGIRPVTGQYVHERALTAEKVQRVFDQTPARTVGKAFIEYFYEITAASNYFDNRVFGNPPPNGDWSPIFSPNQINRQDGYYDLSMMRGDDLEDKASAQLGKAIRLPSLR
jgi:hypothetical protein